MNYCTQKQIKTATSGNERATSSGNLALMMYQTTREQDKNILL